MPTLRRRGIASRMTWNLEKCDGKAVENTTMGLVRPATVDFAGEAVEVVKAGKVIAVPTDTLYGFACDAWYIPKFVSFRCLRSFQFL